MRPGRPPTRRTLGRVPTPRPEVAPIERPAIAVGAVVRDEERRLLVVRRGRPPAAGRWTVPGGHVERGEHLRDAVRREVAEETALDVVVGGLVGVHEVLGDDHHIVILDFHAEVVGGTARAGDDATDLGWMGRGELAAAGPTDGLLDFLDRHGVELAP